MKYLGLTIMGLCAAAALTAPARAQQTFAPGTCVSWGGPVYKVIGSTHPGYSTLEGNGPNHSPLDANNAQLAPAPCPGPRVVKNSCFPSTPDSAARNAIELGIIRSMRKTMEQDADIHYSVRFLSLSEEAPRAFTNEEYSDLGSDPDKTKPVVPAHGVYETCNDDGYQIHVTRFDRNLLCFTSAVTGQFTCGTAASTSEVPAVTQSYPKY